MPSRDTYRNAGRVVEWSTKSDSGTEPILWLQGPAGAGKSAIMKTLSQRLQDAGHLGGAFVFKRGIPLAGTPTLFATIAYQLALNIPALKTPISQSVEDNPSVVGRSMDVQIRELILEPCRSLVNFQSWIVMIDGLDECEGLHIQQEILHLIGDSLHELASPLRFLIASRPEPHIREVFNGESFHGFYRTFNVEKSLTMSRHISVLNLRGFIVNTGRLWPQFQVHGHLKSSSIASSTNPRAILYMQAQSSNLLTTKTFGRYSGWQQLKVLLGVTLNPRLVL
ncbi:hypothetical protein B0H10DRAFT_1327046 [Mycena sp. CBHHK59/15]|nr:hypothetical protein B0H10DRAFT_1327046 [Mycena sp. CBHHK59/15]